MFDTTVTPRWLETSDRFWYAYQRREGRRFTLVDPVKRWLPARGAALTIVPYGPLARLSFAALRSLETGAEVRVAADAPLE